jgi:hypothetical protein
MTSTSVRSKNRAKGTQNQLATSRGLGVTAIAWPTSSSATTGVIA